MTNCSVCGSSDVDIAEAPTGSRRTTHGLELIIERAVICYDCGSRLPFKKA